MTTAHAFPDLYRRLEIDLGKLGCIMLDTEPLDLEDAIAPEDLYVSEHPDRGWIAGPVAERGAHVTLLYGLLGGDYWDDVAEYRADVDEVLTGWEPPAVLRLDRVGTFPSPYPDEPYACLVAHVDDHYGHLEDAHRRLALLPHVQTHPLFVPHLTLAYVRAEAEKRATASLAAALRENLGTAVRTAGLNYGNVRPWEVQA